MKTRLFSPGPVMVPETVMLKMAEPMFHHRTPRYETLFKGVNEKLRKLFMTEGDVFVTASSGSGAMEAAVVNTLSPGDKAIAVRGGKFGERWSELCVAYGIECINIDVEWGYAVTADEIKAAIEANPGVKAVFTTMSETSTGALTDMKAIGAVVKEYADIALVTDAVSGLGVHELNQDAWGVDIIVSGSQKTIMLPPGLGFISVGKDSWPMVERSTLPKYYWDLKKYKKSLASNQNPFTPPVSLIVGLNETLDIILGEGLENMWARHQRVGDAMRAGVKALGLTIFPTDYSNVLTAINMPEGVNGGDLVKALKANGMYPAGGQAQLKGKIIRIAHIGHLDDFDVLTALAGIEKSLIDIGFTGFTPGESVKAALAILVA